MKKTFFIVPALSLGGALLLLAPAQETYGFTKIGGNLDDATQRDWRVFNDFADPQTNNNQTADPNFPGWLGAELALWKAATEWGSVLHGGTGAGDPTQQLGNGGGNFDFVFSGNATSTGGTNRNIVSAGLTCGGGTFAFVETPIGDGWRMRFCEEWTWSDGPGNATGGQIDLQGVGTHEFGHSLGLGHSSVNGATMVGGTFNGNDQRAIIQDDIDGLQCIYGAMLPTKVEITGISISGSTLTITGQNFSASNNQVWFTNANATTPGSEPKVIVSGVASTGGGTQISVSIPANAFDGDVHVKGTGNGHSSLSNGWPIDLAGVGNDPLAISSITPGTVESLIPGTDQTVSINGTGFTPSTTVAVNFVNLDPSSFTVVSDQLITFDMPQAPVLGSQLVTVTEDLNTVLGSINVVAPSAPLLQVGNGDPAEDNIVSTLDGLDVTFAGPVGHTHYAFFSNSNVPSSIPLVTLCLGNFFLDLQFFTLATIPSAGWVNTNTPLAPANALWYFQSITLMQGTPIPTSGCQEVTIVP